MRGKAQIILDDAAADRLERRIERGDAAARPSAMSPAIESWL